MLNGPAFPLFYTLCNAGLLSIMDLSTKPWFVLDQILALDGSQYMGAKYLRITSIFSQFPTCFDLYITDFLFFLSTALDVHSKCALQSSRM